MNPVSAIWNGLLSGIEQGLILLHGLFDPLFGIHAWGWAIIGLTVIIRVLLLPLAIRQTRSMRAMQSLQPEMQRIRKKYKTDRDLMKKNPEKYRENKQKMNEEVMALYKEEGVNPAASCLPLLLQAPIFFALFRVLNNAELQLEGVTISEAPFYVFSPLGEAANASVWGWLLIAGMVVTMFFTTRQMQGQTQVEGAQAQQQKIMQWVMPVFLAFVAQSLPIGVLLYWVTTNLWQLGQQGLILYEVQHHPADPAAGNGQAPSSGAKGAGKGTGKGTRASGKGSSKGGGTNAKNSKKKASGKNRPSKPSKPDHLPRRGGGPTSGRSN